MDLRRELNKGQEELKKHLDMETFGEIMNEFIHKSSVGLLVTKEENEDEWNVRGAGCGSVMDFFILLNAMQPIYQQMLEEMKGKIDPEQLADSLCDLLRDTLKEAAKEQEGQGCTED